MQKGRMRGVAYRGSKLSFGEYGMQALECGWIYNFQIEAARLALVRHMRHAGKVIIRIFPDKPLTKKPAESRMGRGKGNVEYWVAVVKPGRILFEIEGVSEEVAREAVREAGYKLPIKTRFVTQHDIL